MNQMLETKIKKNVISTTKNNRSDIMKLTDAPAAKVTSGTKQKKEQQKVFFKFYFMYMKLIIKLFFYMAITERNFNLCTLLIKKKFFPSLPK